MQALKWVCGGAAARVGDEPGALPPQAHRGRLSPSPPPARRRHARRCASRLPGARRQRLLGARRQRLPGARRRCRLSRPGQGRARLEVGTDPSARDRGGDAGHGRTGKIRGRTGKSRDGCWCWDGATQPSVGVAPAIDRGTRRVPGRGPSHCQNISPKSTAPDSQRLKSTGCFGGTCKVTPVIPHGVLSPDSLATHRRGWASHLAHPITSSHNLFGGQM